MEHYKYHLMTDSLFRFTEPSEKNITGDKTSKNHTSIESHS